MQGRFANNANIAPEVVGFNSNPCLDVRIRPGREKVSNTLGRTRFEALARGQVQWGLAGLVVRAVGVAAPIE